MARRKKSSTALTEDPPAAEDKRERQESENRPFCPVHNCHLDAGSSDPYFTRYYCKFNGKEWTDPETGKKVTRTCFKTGVKVTRPRPQGHIYPPKQHDSYANL